MKKNKTFLVVGSSRGIGAAITEHFSLIGYEVIGVSRGPSRHCTWIQADIATAEGIKHVASSLNNKTIDAFIFSSGIWEANGFSENFDFARTSDNETRNIMAVNVIAPIEITKAIIQNLKSAENPRAIYLGALSGLDQWASQQVAYSASKFGLRGIVQSFRQAFKGEGIGFTVINPGNVATPEVLLDIQEGRTREQNPIPLSDIIASIEWILSVSPCVEVGDVNLIQK